MLKYTLYLEVENHSYEAMNSDDPEGTQGVNYEWVDAFKLFDEKYEIIHDGSLIINPQRPRPLSLVTKNIVPASLSRSQRYKKDDFKYCDNDEIKLIKEQSELKFCQTHNEMELQRVLEEKKNYESLVNQIPGSEEIGNTIVSLERIIGKFILWFRGNNLSTPILKTISESSKAEGEERLKAKAEFKRGDLKRFCERYAKELGLEKGKPLRNKDAHRVFQLIQQKQKYPTTVKSVQSTLRDKLGYRKKHS